MENTMIWDFVWRLVLAALFGTIIGLDREYREKEAGFRTHFLVSLGTLQWRAPGFSGNKSFMP